MAGDPIEDYLAGLGIKPTPGGTTTTKVPAPAIPPNPYGFAPVGDGTQAVNPNFKTSASKTGAYTYYDQNTKSWVSPRPATSDILNLPRVGGVTPQGGAAAATPGAPSPAAGAPTTSPQGTRQMSTGNYGTGTQFNVPGSYQRGPSGFTGNALPGGSFSPFEINFGGSVPTPQSPPDPLKVAPQAAQAVQGVGNSLTGGLNAVLGAARQSVGLPTTPGPGPAPVSRTTGENGLVGGPGIDLTAMNGQFLTDGSAWFPIRGGSVVSPQVVELIAQKWADKPQEIPTALAIAARESNGNPAAEGVNGPQTGAPGTHDNGTFQLNDMHLAGTPTSANGGVGTLGNPNYTREAMKDPATNIAAARQLYDNNAGWSAWGGPNPYQPVGYGVSNLQSGTPPPNAIGPVTGEVGQGFTSSPTSPTLPPVVQPQVPSTPPALTPQADPNYPKMGPQTGSVPGPGMPPPANTPMAPKGFQWSTPPAWVTASLYPNSDQNLPNRILDGNLGPSTSPSGRAPAGLVGGLNGGIASQQNPASIWNLPPAQPDIWARARAGEFANQPSQSTYQSPQSGPPVPPVIAQGNAAQRPSTPSPTPDPLAPVGSSTSAGAPFSSTLSRINSLVNQYKSTNVNSGTAGNAVGGNINAGSVGSVPMQPAPAQSPGTRILMDGPQIAHLGDRSMGYNPQMYLGGPGQPRSTGDAATDAVLAAQVIQKQQASQGAGGNVAPTAIGQSVFYQGEKSGPLEWRTRMDSGDDFSPGKVNGGPMLRSPAGADSPVLLPTGVTVRSSTDASPAQQAYNAQAAGLAPVAPTSNVGAVYQQSYNAAQNPQYASAANLPSQADALALAAAQAQMEKDREGGGADGPVRGFAQGGDVVAGYTPGPEKPPLGEGPLDFQPYSNEDIERANLANTQDGPAQQRALNEALQRQGVSVPLANIANFGTLPPIAQANDISGVSGHEKIGVVPAAPGQVEIAAHEMMHSINSLLTPAQQSELNAVMVAQPSMWAGGHGRDLTAYGENMGRTPLPPGLVEFLNRNGADLLQREKMAETTGNWPQGGALFPDKNAPPAFYPQFPPGQGGRTPPPPSWEQPRGFATGGQISYNPNAPVNQRDLAIALSNFGKKEAGPGDSRFSSIAVQQWNPNNDLIHHFAAGGSVTTDPLGFTPVGGTRSTNGLGAPPDSNPYAGPGFTIPNPTPGNNPSVLAPYQQALTDFNAQQHVRDVTAYQRQHAGLGADQAIYTTGDETSLDPLRPGQHYDPTHAIDQRMSDITGLQDTLAGYGNPGDPTDLLAQQNQLTTEQARYQRALDLQNKIQGYGDIGDPGALETQHNALLQQLAPLQQIQQYQQELAALGNQRDPATILSEKSSIEGSIKMIQDSIAQAQAGGPPSQFSGNEIAGLQAQLASLNNEATQSQSAANRRAELSNLLGGNTLPVDSQIGTLNAQKAALEQQINNTQASAAARAEAQNQLNGLINPGEDINAGLAGVQAKLAPLGQQIANANKAADTRTTLSNLLSRSIPKFASGGSMVTQEPMVGIPARELMAHQTPQFMVGEPQTPGGPPMAEKLNIQPLNRPASPSPLARRIVPSLADPLRPMSAVA